MKLFCLALVGFLPLVASARETEKVIVDVPRFSKGKVIWQKIQTTRPKQAKIARGGDFSDRKLPFFFEGKEYYFLLTK